MTSNITFIADFFVDEVSGGGELVNEVLITELTKRGHVVEKLHSREIIPKSIHDRGDSFFIVANFVQMSEESKQALLGRRYLIFEHDHKYLTTRDPSAFPNYIAPESHIINKDFYKQSQAVVCQSRIHAEVVQSNLLINNIVNLGCSLWSDEELTSLRRASERKKIKKTAILSSTNRVKGTPQAVAYCKRNNLDYDLIAPCEFGTLMGTLAEYESVVFFSQVLETFCRLVVEARALGCKVITNNNNGCTSEPWFASKKGHDLIDFISDSRNGIVDTIESVILGQEKEIFFVPENSSDTKDLTVILNSYRRPYNLKRQIAAIRKQTKGCKEIWLWVNKHEDNEGFDYSDLGIDRIFDNNHNWKFYGRFAAALLSDTEYIAIFDDDTIPGNKWFENCFDTMKENEGILGTAGVVLNGSRYHQHDRCGWPTQNKETEEVDLVGHAWFFKREWLQYLWKEKPPTWDNGEDIQFAYSAKKYGGIKTFCPPHPAENKEMHGSTLGNELGIDSKATSNNNETTHQQFFIERDACVQHALKNGWETVRQVAL